MLTQDAPIEIAQARPRPVSADRSDQAPLRRQLARYALDIGAPIALYYVLRAAGASNLAALSAGAAVPACSVVITLCTRRPADAVALLVLTTFVVSIGASVIANDPRFLLAKEGVLTGVWGLWFTVSIRARRPAAFVFARPLMEGRRLFGDADWDALWASSARFRRIWRTSTLVWGGAMLVDAALRVAMAYSLPIGVVPALSGALWPATFVLIQVVTNVYYHRAGLYQILGARWLARG